MKMYRLVYSDGTHGAWTTNYSRIKALADFFLGARIETMERAFRLFFIGGAPAIDLARFLLYHSFQHFVN